MDRTIPPGIPGGEDAGAVVGVVGLDSKGRNSIMANNKATLGHRRTADRAKADPEGRIGVREADLADVPVDRIAKSSADPER